jgi:hypothetical protein
MVQRVLPAPMAIRRQIEQARDYAQYIIGAARIKKRSVTAVMEDYEDSGEKAGSENANRQHEPVGNVERVVHHEPQDYVRDKGVDYLPLRAPRRRTLKSL